MNEENEVDVAEKKKAVPLPFEPDGEVLDWDFYQPPPPPKRRWKIQVRLVYKGRARPMPTPDPDEEFC